MPTVKKIMEEESFFHYFQPIYNLCNWKRVGYDVLFRTDCSMNTREAFQMAMDEEKLYELDTMSIRKAVEYYNQEGFTSFNGLLFLHVFPSTLRHPSFVRFLKELLHDHNKQEVILEINQWEGIPDYDELQTPLKNIRALGVKVAIDDFGNEIAALIEMKPEYIKMEKYMTTNLEHSPEKQFMIDCINQYSHRFNSKLIVKGLQSPEELALTKSLGVSLAQGDVLYPASKLQEYKLL
ncbi:EAL domain-containing protein [Halobacillus sp. Marseille-Q1614]|uniref:EAL domain-containing protein n=1 Tax=Halobacillus sp. Marseille-Q1614 TaxID=2709134 RepID=UPI00156F61BA|nr:EAL domain-containing protein [Halobacillus sp. Marseille-Q1614]